MPAHDRRGTIECLKLLVGSPKPDGCLSFLCLFLLSLLLDERHIEKRVWCLLCGNLPKNLCICIAAWSVNRLINFLEDGLACDEALTELKVTNRLASEVGREI